jgi:hypothetical protein
MNNTKVNIGRYQLKGVPFSREHNLTFSSKAAIL